MSRGFVKTLGTNKLGIDAWGRQKTVQDFSLLHGVFTFNVPASIWKETFNGVEQLSTNATSDDGKLSLLSGATLNDITMLSTFRNPRYQANRGNLYSSSIFLPNDTELGNRRFGIFTDESGTFFSLESGTLYGVIRTTVGGITTDDKHLIDLTGTGIDLNKGNVFDIQHQWRGVGDFKFFINLKEVLSVDYLGTLSELSMFNPSNPISFECENLGDEVEIQCGCVDFSTEGGIDEKGVYGSISVDNQAGKVAISGFNQPVIAVRSKLAVGGLINTRDTLSLLASAYGDQRCLLRVWVTRDFTAITENDQSWVDFGDGHLEYITYDVPDVITPMTFDTTKAVSVFGSRVDQDQTYSTSALFEGRTNIYLTPGDMFVFTMHRETGGTTNVGATFEFAEEI